MKKVLMLLLVAFIFAGCSNFKKVITIPQSTIQEALNKAFPFDKNAVIARIIFSDPEVYLKDPSIGMKMMYVGNFMEKEVQGDIDVNGHLVYREGAFYLNGFQVVNFTVAEKEFSSDGRLKKVILKILQNYVDKYPIYKLKQADFKQSLARLLLKDVVIFNDELVVTIGL